MRSSAFHSGHGEFARSRAQAEAETAMLRDRAVRTVTGQAVDAEDLHSLLAMLGLEQAHGPSRLRGGLAGYVREVAAAVGVPPEATGFEISDTATAYLGLSVRWALRPSRDLMLVWTEAQGWSLAVETEPTERPAVLGYFGGDDVVPVPHAVARFVTGMIHTRPMPTACPAFGVNREELARRLQRYAVQ